MSKTKNVLKEVLAERSRQDGMWGEQNHPNGTGGSTSKILARAYRQLCQDNFDKGLGTWTDILKEEFYEALAENDPIKLRTELLQVAAVCCSWVEAIDRAK